MKRTYILSPFTVSGRIAGVAVFALATTRSTSFRFMMKVAERDASVVLPPFWSQMIRLVVAVGAMAAWLPENAVEIEVLCVAFACVCCVVAPAIWLNIEQSMRSAHQSCKP